MLLKHQSREREKKKKKREIQNFSLDAHEICV